MRAALAARRSGRRRARCANRTLGMFTPVAETIAPPQHAGHTMQMIGLIGAAALMCHRIAENRRAKRHPLAQAQAQAQAQLTGAHSARP